jgi:hypothetical protein
LDHCCRRTRDKLQNQRKEFGTTSGGAAWGRTRVTTRPIEPADAPLLAGFAELSEESRDGRFFTLKDEFDDRQLPT